MNLLFGWKDIVRRSNTALMKKERSGNMLGIRQLLNIVDMFYRLPQQANFLSGFGGRSGWRVITPCVSFMRQLEKQ